MIVYVPGRMPNQVNQYGAARYPGLLGSRGYYSPVSSFYHQASQFQPSPYQVDINWPYKMPTEDDLNVSPPGAISLGASPMGPVSAGPASPAHSDSDASNSSLELGSVRRNENAQLKCRWSNCGKWFTSLEHLAGHVARSHSAPGLRGLFYCGWEGCPRGERGFNARYKMLVHVRTHTNEKPHHCFQCDKSFSRAENLKIHARSHTGERPYVCPVEGCNKAYSNSSDRFKHTRTHSVDKPYCCKVPGCPKRYTDPSSLRKHVKTYRHYVDKPQGFEEVTPEKSSESDKKDSSLESVGSSPGQSSFEEQRKIVDWKNSYNLVQDQVGPLQVTPPKNFGAFPRIFDEFRTPERLQAPEMGNSTPIEDKVDYRNIDSIVAPPVRHSVIRRVDQMDVDLDNGSDQCCRHKCCVHTDQLLEKTKILSDLILKTQDPVFRQLLGRVDLKYELQGMWSHLGVRESPGAVRVKEESQELPLDLTVHK